MISAAGMALINGPAVSLHAAGPVVAVTVQAPIPKLGGSLSSPDVGVVDLVFRARPPISTGQAQIDAILARAQPTVYDAVFEGALPPGAYQIRLTGPDGELPPVQFALSAIIPHGSAPVPPSTPRQAPRQGAGVGAGPSPASPTLGSLGPLVAALNDLTDVDTTETAMVLDGSIWSWSCPFDVAVIRGIRLTGCVPGFISASITAGSDRVPLIVHGRDDNGDVVWDAEYHTVPTLLRGWTISLQRPTNIASAKLIIAS